MFRKNEDVTLSITEINNLGCGVGKKDGMTFFVKGAVGGDEVEASIIKVNKTYCVARLVRVIKPSPFRTSEGFCDAPEACGGCVYRHIDYAYELSMKQNYVQNAFRKAGLPDVRVEAVRTAGDPRGYRNKVQYPFGISDGRVCIGFYAGKTHKVIPCANCALGAPLFAEIGAFVCDYANEKGLSVYDENTGKGLLRHLYLREGKNTGEVMVCLVVNGDSLPDEKGFSDALCARFPRVVSVILNENKKNTNVILGRTYRMLRGKDHIEDVLCGKRFRIAPAAFYQVNHDGAELLYATAAEKAALSGKETLLDLYCGIGTIGISLSDKVKKLVGIEIVDAAVKCAKENADLNGLADAEFFCGDAGDAENLVARALALCGEMPTVIVDPPRKGLDAALIHHLAQKNIERIVYVSCDPDTLARDCKLFSALGYEIGTVTPVDMFPRTGHVENVVCLSREKITHEMKLNPTPFAMIKSGEKTVELRLFDEKRQRIKAGDTIVFTDTATGETLTKTVAKLHRFDSFDELYKSLPLLQCGYTSEDVEKADPSDMELYYSVEAQKKYGVVGIELC